MKEKVDEVLESIERIEEQTVMGSVPRATGEFLEFLVLATESKNILELGCSIGYSAIWMAKAAKEIGGHIYTTEIAQDRIKLAKNHFEESGMNEFITLYEQDIIEVLSDWKNGEIDFVFIDAEKTEYLRYYELVLPLLRKGGIIVADDVGKFKEEVQPFLDKVKQDTRVVSQNLELDDGLMLIYKK